MSDSVIRQASIDGLGSQSPGIRLKAAREAQGQSIDVLSRTLHVSPQVLVAMETDAFNYFDAPVFARGYLRQYAGCLRLPVDDIIAAYDELASGPDLPSLIPPMSIRQVVRRWPTVRMPPWWVIASVIIVTVVGVWRLSHPGYRWFPASDGPVTGVEATAPAAGTPPTDAQPGSEATSAGAASNAHRHDALSNAVRPK